MNMVTILDNVMKADIYDVY